MKKIILLLATGLFLTTLSISTAQSQSETDGSTYKSAIGLRLGWGLNITGKHFISDNHALEGIFSYRGRGLAGWSTTRIAANYQVHYDLDVIDEIDNLRWYWGVGGLVGFDNFRSFDNIVFFGITGVIGLDYKFDGIPINISLDLMPTLEIGGNREFFNTGRGLKLNLGGLAVRYTLQ
jgi:hypothetical protein